MHIRLPFGSTPTPRDEPEGQSETLIEVPLGPLGVAQKATKVVPFHDMGPHLFFQGPGGSVGLRSGQYKVFSGMTSTMTVLLPKRRQ